MSQQRAAGPHIVLVAGEPSGDNLGAQLIEALRRRFPNARFSGIAGPAMRAAGCQAWFEAERLAVMGLLQVLPQLPRLLRIRRQLIDRTVAERADVYVGVDFKEFNLNVARALKAKGLRTVQYVSPQVWAWRQGRVRTIGQAVNTVLCLFPFEAAFYAQHAVDARFVGHPLADQIPMHVDRGQARQQLGLSDRTCVALLPGSRRGEVAALGLDFAKTAAWLLERRPDLQFVAAIANEHAQRLFAAALQTAGMADRVKLVTHAAHAVMAASDAVLLASGTATLEAALLKRPMVVAYRLDAFSTWVLATFKLFKAKFFALPNLLADRRLVPEFFNEQVTAALLGPAVLEQLQRTDLAALQQAYETMHVALRRDASVQAAQAIAEQLPEYG
jgi:lipid-A-disaccharide synthase